MVPIPKPTPQIKTLTTYTTLLNPLRRQRQSQDLMFLLERTIQSVRPPLPSAKWVLYSLQIAFSTYRQQQQCHRQLPCLLIVLQHCLLRRRQFVQFRLDLISRMDLKIPKYLRLCEQAQSTRSLLWRRPSCQLLLWAFPFHLPQTLPGRR
jgi:hypothetical protein